MDKAAAAMRTQHQKRRPRALKLAHDDAACLTFIDNGFDAGRQWRKFLLGKERLQALLSFGAHIVLHVIRFQPGFVGDMESMDDGEVRSWKESCGRKRSEEHTSELQSLMRNSYAAFCLKKT